jgi:integrase
VVSKAEENAVLAFFAERGMADHAEVVVMLIDTGLRPSELWRLTAKDYNAGVLFVRVSKNDRPRAIPLTARATLIVERRLGGPDKLFDYDNKWVQYGWGLAKKHLGLHADKEFLVYALRHTCASRLVQANVPLQVVQGWLGHTSITTTTRYAHLGMENYQAAMKTLEG